MDHLAMETLWKSIIGYENIYEVSNKGEIKSLSRIVEYSNGKKVLLKEKIMRQPLNKGGYPFVSLKKDKTSKTKPVHVIVCETFLGDRPLGYHVCHNDGNKLNNNLYNLRYDTAKNNAQDKRLHGTYQVGDTASFKVLNEDSVLKIVKLLVDGYTCKSIADFFSVSEDSVKHIKKKSTWSHLEEVKSAIYCKNKNRKVLEISLTSP